MAAVNYYHGLKRGASANTGGVVVAAATQGTAVDVEVRIQTNNGSVATGITVKDVELLLNTIRAEIIQRGITGNLGLDLPVL